jgi:hypothetical protein
MLRLASLTELHPKNLAQPGNFTSIMDVDRAEHQPAGDS